MLKSDQNVVNNVIISLDKTKNKSFGGCSSGFASITEQSAIYPGPNPRSQVSCASILINKMIGYLLKGRDLCNTAAILSATSVRYRHLADAVTQTGVRYSIPRAA